MPQGLNKKWLKGTQVAGKSIWEGALTKYRKSTYVLLDAEKIMDLRVHSIYTWNLSTMLEVRLKGKNWLRHWRKLLRKGTKKCYRKLGSICLLIWYKKLLKKWDWIKTLLFLSLIEFSLRIWVVINPNSVHQPPNSWGK